MSSPIAHGLSAYALLVTLEPALARDPGTNRKALLAGVVLGSLADADFLVAPFTTNPVWQHHYFSHSIFFALFFTLVCFVAAKLWKHQQPWKTAGLLGVAYASHLLLDLFTADGSPPVGIPLFWPITHTHLAPPIEIFLSIHRGDIQTLLGAHNWIAVSREILLTLPIALLAFGAARRSSNAGGSPASLETR